MALLNFIKKLFTRREMIESPSLTHSLNHIEQQPPPTTSIEHDSYHLGLAAGYTGKSIKDIESSLVRLESQMVSKDWFLVHFQSFSQQLTETMLLVRRILEQMAKSGYNLPIIQTTVDLPRITPKMALLAEIVREVKEISYEDLAARLGMNTVHGLRSLLSESVKQIPELERFKRKRKGWVRYKETAQQVIESPSLTQSTNIPASTQETTDNPKENSIT